MNDQDPSAASENRLRESWLEGMSGFWLRFPEVAPRETRVVKLLYPQDGLLAGSYGFLELCKKGGFAVRRA